MIKPDELVKGSYYEVIYPASTGEEVNVYLCEATSHRSVRVHWRNGRKSNTTGGIMTAESIRLVSKEYVMFKGNIPTNNKAAVSLLEKE